MQIKPKHLAQGRHRTVVSCYVEDCDDLWVLYNVITKGDYVASSTKRKVSKELETRSSLSKVQHGYVKILVNKLDFCADKADLRVSGTVAEVNNVIPLGRFHTLSITTGSSLKIEKDEWDTFSYSKLEYSIKTCKKPSIAVLLMDMGIANLFLVSDCIVRTLATIEHHVPKKRTVNAQYDTAKETFFVKVYDRILKELDLYALSCMVFSGPGLVKEQFFQWMMDRAMNTHSLEEVIANERVRTMSSSLKILKEINEMERFLSLLHCSPQKTTYGPQHVGYVIDIKAVETLLLTDQLFRSCDVTTRRHYTQLVDKAKSQGSNIMILSDNNSRGAELQSLGGVGAILRYAVPELDAL